MSDEDGINCWWTVDSAGKTVCVTPGSPVEIKVSTIPSDHPNVADGFSYHYEDLASGLAVTGHDESHAGTFLPVDFEIDRK